MEIQKIACPVCGHQINPDSYDLHRYICQKRRKKEKNSRRKTKKGSPQKRKEKRSNKADFRTHRTKKCIEGGILNSIRKKYAQPKLSDSFFQRNDPFSSRLVPPAEATIQFNLKTPQMQGILNDLFKNSITRHEKQACIITKITSPEKIIQLMVEGIDPLNQLIFIKKALSLEAQILPRIIEALESNRSASFAELSVFILYQSTQDWITPLLKMLPRIIDSYTLSLECLFLGMKGPKKVTSHVWKAWNFFHDHGYDHTGPYLALEELHTRFDLSR